MTAAGLWLILALVLAVAELLVPGVFLIFVAGAAAITGLTALALPELPLAAQIGSLAVWSIVIVSIGRRWYHENPVATSDERLNDRSARLVGEIVTIEAAIVDGHGRARVGDGTWPARGPDLPAGARVRVTAVEGGVLVVEAG